MGKMIYVPNSNYSSLNMGQGTITSILPLEALSIVGKSYVYNYGQFAPKYFPIFSSERNVSWSVISGSQYATIDQNGLVTAAIGSDKEDVMIRCSSTENPEIYVDKSIVVSAKSLVYHDYLESDGTTYFVTPGFDGLVGAKVIVRGTLNNNNGYLVSCRKDESATKERIAAYKNNAGNIAALVGSQGFSGTTSRPETTSTVYRWEFNLSTTASSYNGSVSIYKDSDNTLVRTVSSALVTLSGLISIFTLGYGAYGGSFTDSDGTHGSCRFYSLVVEKDEETLIDYRPVTIDGTAAIIDEISGNVYYAVGDSGIIAGDES